MVKTTEYFTSSTSRKPLITKPPLKTPSLNLPHTCAGVRDCITRYKCFPEANMNPNRCSAVYAKTGSSGTGSGVIATIFLFYGVAGLAWPGLTIAYYAEILPAWGLPWVCMLEHERFSKEMPRIAYFHLYNKFNPYLRSRSALTEIPSPL